MNQIEMAETIVQLRTDLAEQKAKDLEQYNEWTTRVEKAEADLAMTKKLHEHAVAEVHSGVEIIKQLHTDLAAAEKERSRVASRLDSERTITELLSADLKLCKADIELRKDYESYLQSTAGPMYSYNSWKKQQAQKGDTE